MPVVIVDGKGVGVFLELAVAALVRLASRQGDERCGGAQTGPYRLILKISIYLLKFGTKIVKYFVIRKFFANFA